MMQKKSYQYQQDFNKADLITGHNDIFLPYTIDESNLSGKIG